MSKALITNSTLTDIADAIRAKGGTSASMLPSEMPDAIAALPSAVDRWAAYWQAQHDQSLEVLDFDALYSADVALSLGLSPNYQMTVSYYTCYPFRNTLKRLIASSAKIQGAAFTAQTKLEYLSIFQLENNQSAWPNKLSTFTTIVVKSQSSSVVIGYTTFLSRMCDACKIYCNDQKHIENIDGTWTVVND